jgi:signal transduction histidine kinase
VLSRCSIRNKLLLGAAMLFLIVATLSVTGIIGVTSYRQLVRNVSDRAAEWPLAEDLTQSINGLRHTANELYRWQEQGDRTNFGPVAIREELRLNLADVKRALMNYRAQLDLVEPYDSGIADIRVEREKVNEIERALAQIDSWINENEWMVDRSFAGPLNEELEQLHGMASGLPKLLQQRMQELKGNVRGQYHTLIALTLTSSILATGMLAFLVKYFYDWVFRPLRVLIRGSRQVASGDFNHRIQMPTHDEMAELATAMNNMTNRFQEIRDDLDQQVKLRTKEVVRSEQLASVGYLAAGVSHEINNPLASIAWCAEALESRLHDILYQNENSQEEPNSDQDVLRRYLRRIQDEAFRCKGITEKLLDFSRIGEVDRQEADLRGLVQDVIDMVKHLGRYRNKRIEFNSVAPVMALVNSQEIKQVVLNLITNALDSLDTNGVVNVQVQRLGEVADLRVVDDGCGMTEETREHLFEPFFTRRRDGQGTGLGLSIAYRIVVDHGGRIEAHSDGPGKGSTFHVTLPLVQNEKKHEKQFQAA